VAEAKPVFLRRFLELERPFEERTPLSLPTAPDAVSGSPV